MGCKAMIETIQNTLLEKRINVEKSIEALWVSKTFQNEERVHRLLEEKESITMLKNWIGMNEEKLLNVCLDKQKKSKEG